MDDAELRTAVATWIDGDPDQATSSALADALARDDVQQLRAAMEPPLAFGTAGLRGVVGPGPARMNRAVVIRTTWAVTEQLAATGQAGSVVCVGHDARPDSARFSQDVMGVLLAAGHHVAAWRSHVPTPMVAWAAREMGAAAAIVVTASHNPPADNGYKLYAGDAIQIVPPLDREIAALRDAAPPAASIPRVEDVWEHEALEDLGPYARGRYLDQVLHLLPAVGARGQIRVAHTSLHGVGGEVVVEALRRSGVDDVHVVAAQHEPDGAFPTVPFPNPEEEGALDLAFNLAGEVGADIILANDPDTDRLAVAIEDEDGWRRLSGNEVGVLLADDLLRRAPDRALVCASIVSSPWLGVVAAHHGARFEQTLTGFKWIWHAAYALEAEGWTPVLGTEEALGYSVGTVVRDKDGISAAVVMADLARRLAAEGGSLGQRLAGLRARDGVWVAAQRSATRAGADGRASIDAAMTHVRGAPPAILDGLDVTEVLDFATGAAQRPAWLPDSDLIELALTAADGTVRGRALIRPSGTEPKCKVYVDLQATGPDADVVSVRDLAERVAQRLLDHVGLTDA